MDEKARIGVMDSLLFAITLEVMLLQMRILGIYCELAVWCSVVRLCDFESHESSAERRFPGHGPQTKREKQLRDKLLRDRKNVKEVSLRTLVDLTESGEYYTFKKTLNILVNNTNCVITLRARYEKLKQSLEKITRELQKNRQQWTIELRNCDINIAFIRDNIKDNALNSRFQFDYVDKLLCAREEVMEMKMQEAPTTPPRLENENCVHSELLRAYTLQIKEREELLEYWKLRYTKDTTDLDARFAEQCEKLRVTLAHRGEFESLYKLHDGEMRAWLTFKRERAARLAREERLRRAATRVQAWWRGVMVRRALGTYRYLRNVKKTAPKTKKK